MKLPSNILVRVYWNLHKNCWSIQHKGKVVEHANSILLKNVRFSVSEAGRQRVLREKRKNVHAFAKGELVAINEKCPSDLILEISYNPYKFGFFFNRSTQEEIKNNLLVYCGDRILFGS